DVGVVDTHHHLRVSPPGSAAGIDGSGRCIGTTHEGNPPGSGTAGGQQLLAGTDTGEIDPCTRATLEDDPLFLVPVEDRLHGVVHGQDEAGTDLLGRVRSDVEPDRGVEAEHLVRQGVLQLVVEDLGVFLGGEVAVLGTGPGVDVHDPVDELLEAPLAFGGADRATEVLAHHDLGGVHRPGDRKLHPALLEVDGAVAPVGHDDVAPLPVERFVGVYARDGEDAFD